MCGQGVPVDRSGLLVDLHGQLTDCVHEFSALTVTEHPKFSKTAKSSGYK